MRTETNQLLAIRKHFENRVLATGELLNDVGILVAAKSLRPDQQTFVQKAVRDPALPRGSNMPPNPTAGAHLVAGGVYVVHRSGQPRFGTLRRKGYEEDRHGLIAAPLYWSANSPEGRRIIYPHPTETSIIPTLANRLESLVEGLYGNQRRENAGEKRALEEAVSFTKTSASGRSVPAIVEIATEQCARVCTFVAQRIAGIDARLRDAEKESSGERRQTIQLLREYGQIKYEVVTQAPVADMRRMLIQEGAHLLDYETQSAKSSDNSYEASSAESGHIVETTSFNGSNKSSE